MVVTAILRFRINPVSLESFGEKNERDDNSMIDLIKTIPGYIGYREFFSDDGEGIKLVQFSDVNGLDAWRDHPDHVFLKKEYLKEGHITSYEVSIFENGENYNMKCPRIVDPAA